MIAHTTSSHRGGEAISSTKEKRFISMIDNHGDDDNQCQSENLPSIPRVIAPCGVLNK